MPIEEPFKHGADFDYLREVILRRTTDGPVPVIEMMADGSIMGEVTGLEHTIDQMTELTDLDNPDRKGPRRSSGDGLKFLELNLAFSKAVGYDSVINFVPVPLTQTRAQYSESRGKDGSRPWQNEHRGLIPDRAAFDDFEWPDPDLISTSALDYMAPKLPPGMRIHVMHMGVFEDLRALMGFEPMAIKSIEEPELLGEYPAEADRPCGRGNRPGRCPSGDGGRILCRRYGVQDEHHALARLLPGVGHSMPQADRRGVPQTRQALFCFTPAVRSTSSWRT